MSPDDPTPPPDDEHDDVAGPGSDDDPEIPPPATWAGRERAGGDEGEGDEDEGSDREPGGDDDEGEGWGFTEELDEVERELGASLDDEVEGEEPSDATAEADTLALADREEAEEAALAGLRARAAGEAAKRDTKAEAAAGAPVAAPPASAAATETPATPAAPAEPASEPPAAPAPDEAGEAPRPRALWARFLAASLLIVIATATATSLSLLFVLHDLAADFGGIQGVEDELTEVSGRDPQTILILGSDERLGPQEPGGARSDTAILLRVDPDNDVIGLLSIPRDLKVNIPGVGVDKFNAAYANDGPRKTLRVVKQLTGLEINHMVNINFTGFADAVNAIDCVFVDVDRRYFVPEGSGYAAIDPPIEAGYQKLCGLKALQYVRFRHDDNDLVRAARQQDFLREARQKIPPSKMFEERDELLRIFKEYTTSDPALKDPIQLLELLKTFLRARNATVNEVHFPARLRPSYVTANQKEVKETVRQFLGTEGTPGPKPGSARKDRDRKQGGGGQGGQGGQRPAGEEPESKPDADAGPAMIDDGRSQEYAQQVAGATSPSGTRLIIDFPIFHPTQVPARTDFNPIGASRAFPIDGPGDDRYEGYKLVYGIPGAAGFREYWGVSGTSWSDPPILENPSERRKIDGREYLLFYDSDRLRLVGFKEGGRSYWVNNTLLQSLDEREMLAIARSLRRLGG